MHGHRHRHRPPACARRRREKIVHQAVSTKYVYVRLLCPGPADLFGTLRHMPHAHLLSMYHARGVVRVQRLRFHSD